MDAAGLGGNTVADFNAYCSAYESLNLSRNDKYSDSVLPDRYTAVAKRLGDLYKTALVVELGIQRARGQLQLTKDIIKSVLGDAEADQVTARMHAKGNALIAAPGGAALATIDPRLTPESGVLCVKTNLVLHFIYAGLAPQVFCACLY